MIPTKSYRRPQVEERFQELADRSVHEIVTRARAAGLAFVAGVDSGWGRVEVARWLLQAYAPVVAFAPPSQVAVSAARSSFTSESLERVLLDTRDRIVKMLATAPGEWEEAGFAAHMVEGGFVVGVRDRDGALGFAPNDRPDMRLVDRVRSLFVADFLTRPHDYARLEVCEDCGRISFEGNLEHADWCWEPPAVSGVFTSSGRPARWDTVQGI